MTDNTKIRGPDLDAAWTVLEGAVVIIGPEDTVTFPAGSMWPGLRALPAALIQMQLMRSVRQSVPDRVSLLRSIADLTSDNRETVATALGLSRHTFRGETLQLLGSAPYSSASRIQTGSHFDPDPRQDG